MRSHILLSDLADYLSRTKVLDLASQEHLETCHYCRSDLRWLEQLRSLRKLEPPKSALETALKFFRKTDAA